MTVMIATPRPALMIGPAAKKVLRFFQLWPDRPWTDQEISALCVELDAAWAKPYIDGLILFGRLVVVGHAVVKGETVRLVRLNKEYSRD